MVVITILILVALVATCAALWYAVRTHKTVQSLESKVETFFKSKL